MHTTTTAQVATRHSHSINAGLTSATKLELCDFLMGKQCQEMGLRLIASNVSRLSVCLDFHMHIEAPMKHI